MSQGELDGNVNAALALTADDFKRFLRIKNIAAACTVCGKGQYSVVTDVPGLKALIVAAPIMPTQEAALWYLNLACDSCGHTYFFNVSTVLEALKAAEIAE